MAGSSGRLGVESIEIRGERIEKALSLAWKVHKKPGKPFHVEKVRKTKPPSEVFISFPGSGAVKDWYSQKPFGECEIDLKLFPSLKRIGLNEAAKVNEDFQTRFKAILLLAKPSLEKEVEKAMKKGKQIVFTGHSSGAPMAILATLWTLEKYMTPKSHDGVPPLCVTFGSPLIGNHVFSHAIRRENWSTNFMHFVMRYDIVPRILFAPLSSFDQSSEAILQSFNPKSKSFMSESIGRSATSAAYDFYFSVLSNTATVTSHAASKLMGSTDSTLETLANFVPLSPYRPFGTYIFCTGNGKKIVIKNPDAVLQVLFFSAQLSTEAEADQVATRSLQEHRVSGTKQLLTSGMENVVHLNQEQLEELPLTDDDSRDEISLALNDFGLSKRARLCLRAAAELEKRRSNNEELMKELVNSAEEDMNELEKYRDYWANNRVGYYDAFRQQKDHESFIANVKRLELTSVWDEIMGKLRSFELPDELEGKSEWVEHGTRYRRLVEPLDVANYYRQFLRHVEAGPYMEIGRPRKYRHIQRWLEHAEGRGVEKDTYSESCFWAEVEELCIITSNNNGSFEGVKERVERLEDQIKSYIDKGKLNKDVFFEGSTLVKWWKALPPQHRGELVSSEFHLSVTGNQVAIMHFQEEKMVFVTPLCGVDATRLRTTSH